VTSSLLATQSDARETSTSREVFPSGNPFTNALLDLKQRPYGNLPCLDVLRSVAILMVLNLHVGEFFSPGVQNLPFVFYGWSGVDLFFVLSGFLIGGQLWKELSRRGDIDVKRFILRRGLRIWPLYYAFILAVGGASLARGKPVTGFLVDALCVSNYFHHKIAGGWSLSTEEQFYVLTPVLLYLGSRVIPHRKLIALPIIWLLALPLLRWLILRGAPPSEVHRLTYFPFHTHSDGLAAGLIIAWMAVMRPGVFKSKFWSNAGVLVAGVLVGLFLRRLDQPVFRFSSLAVLYGLVVLFLLRARTLPGVLNWHGFYVISRLSYGMYLNQFHVVDFIPKLTPLVGEGLFGFAICWTLSLIGSLAAAYLTFAVVEVPFLALRQQWLARTRHQTVAA
jgi:peptidoglycan/LPS O-acetylase OafA/YrhL